jgi:anti-sigma B factor antagonist
MSASPASVVERRTLDERTSVLSVHGEIDFATAPELKLAIDAALEEGARRLVIDLLDVSFLDGAGVRVILAGDLRSRLRGASAAIVCRDPHLLNLFSLTAVSPRVEIFSSLDEAFEQAA